MNTPACKPPHAHGSVLIMTMIMTLIVGIALTSYLYLIRFQNLSVVHSQAWNAALAVAEAGVEESFAQLNSGPLGMSANLAANGWAQAGNNYSAPQRTIGDGSYQVSVVASTPVTSAMIYSTGYTTVSYSGVTASRAIRVAASNMFAFTGAVAAQTTVDLNGNTISVDSYDSSNPSYSTNGKWDPTKARDKGDVSSNSGFTNSIMVGNAKVKGKVRTGPTGLPSIGSNGSVGSSAWVDNGNKGIQSGWSKNDMNVEFPDVQAPFTSAAAVPKGGKINGTNYTYVLGTDNYQLPSIKMSTGDRLLVTGDAVLYVTGNLTMLGTSAIDVAPGAKLRVYVGGADAGFTYVNTDGLPDSFQYYGLPGNTSMSLSGSSQYVGVFYAPQATATLGGGGKNDYDVSGSLVMKALKMNGHFNIHYDENLGRTGPRLRYVATSWTEL